MTLRILLNDIGTQCAINLEQALVDAGYSVVARFDKNTDLVDKVKKVDPDVIVIDFDTAYEEIMNKLKMLDKVNPKPIVMFTNHSDDRMIDTAVKAGVSAFIVDGLTARRIKPIIDVAISRFKETQALKNELKKTKDTLAQRKVIEKAKGIIMKQRSINEDSAFQMLRKTAMDKNKRIIEIAENIVSVAELLNDSYRQEY